MSSKPVLLVLGAGKNIGQALAHKFSSAGYSIALAARSIPDGTTPEGHFGIKVDLSDPSAIPSVFAKVKASLGTPNTVIYNAANLTPPPDKENIFSLPVETMKKDLDLMNSSAWVAAGEAVAGFDTLPKGVMKSFIYTGNITSTRVLPVPALVTLGIGKSAASYWVGLASSSFESKGYKFFYGDERKADGGPANMDISGDGHADIYAKLATGELDAPWLVTFVAGKGYVDFSKL